MRVLVISSLLIFSFTTLFGQAKSRPDDIEKNTIYAEAFGQGFAWSLNYDRIFNTDKTFMNSVTAGFVFVPDVVEFGDGTYLGIPVSYNWILGKKSHHLELGVGLTAMYVNSYASYNDQFLYLYASPKISYRFQRPQGGLFFRASATAMIDLLTVSNSNHLGFSRFSISTLSDVVGIGYPVFPWPGVSVGYTFK
ncbi:MAG: hypothetical protein PHQ74_04280 [Crocinitomicaceae bacterium]|nr:hypothetical protein [Crocinitomicaceae bacterium]